MVQVTHELTEGHAVLMDHYKLARMFRHFGKEPPGRFHIEYSGNRHAATTRAVLAKSQFDYVVHPINDTYSKQCLQVSDLPQPIFGAPKVSRDDYHSMMLKLASSSSSSTIGTTTTTATTTESKDRKDNKDNKEQKESKDRQESKDSKATGTKENQHESARESANEGRVTRSMVKVKRRIKS